MIQHQEEVNPIQGNIFFYFRVPNFGDEPAQNNSSDIDPVTGLSYAELEEQKRMMEEFESKGAAGPVGAAYEDEEEDDDEEQQKKMLEYYANQ